LGFSDLQVTRGVKKNWGTGTKTEKLGNRGNRKLENRGPGLEKLKTGYPGLVPGFYRVTGNRVRYIFFIFFSKGVFGLVIFKKIIFKS
jgi:hypothetical protein